MLADEQGTLRSVASSNETARLLELFELQNQEGPCLDCFRTGEQLINQSLAPPDERWPRFGPEARRLGFTVVHALPMRLRGQVIGAVNVFGSSTPRLTQAEIDVGQALADIATVGLLQERSIREARLLNEQLQGALTSRVVIEQAKGMLAERRRIEMDAAFTCCAPTPATPTSGSASWPRRCSTAPSTPRHSSTTERATSSNAMIAGPFGPGDLLVRQGRRESPDHSQFLHRTADATTRLREVAPGPAPHGGYMTAHRPRDGGLRPGCTAHVNVETNRQRPWRHRGAVPTKGTIRAAPDPAAGGVPRRPGPRGADASYAGGARGWPAEA